MTYKSKIIMWATVAVLIILFCHSMSSTTREINMHGFPATDQDGQSLIITFESIKTVCKLNKTQQFKVRTYSVYLGDEYFDHHSLTNTTQDQFDEYIRTQLEAALSIIIDEFNCTITEQ